MDNTESLTFGEVLKRIIKDQNLTNLEASSKLGKTNAAVSRLISDKTSPSIDTALKTLEPFGYTLAVVKDTRKLSSKDFFLHGKPDED